MFLFLIYLSIGILCCSDQNNNNNNPENNASLLFSKKLSPFKFHSECHELDLFPLDTKSLLMQVLEDQVCFLEIKDSEKPKLICQRFSIKDDSTQLTKISCYSFPLNLPAHPFKKYDFEFVNQPSTNNIIFKLYAHAEDSTFQCWNVIYPTNELYSFYDGDLGKSKAIITDPKKTHILYAIIIKNKKSKKVLLLRQYRYDTTTNKITLRSLLKSEGENIDIFERFHNSFIINQEDTLKLAYVLNNKIHTFSYNLTTKVKDSCIYPEKVTDVFFGYDGKIKHFVKLDDTHHQIIIQDTNRVQAQFNIDFSPSSRLILSTQGALGALFCNNEFLLIIDLIAQEIIGCCEINLHEPCYNCRFLDTNNYFVFDHAATFYFCDLKTLKS